MWPPRLHHQTGVLLLSGFSPQAQQSSGQTKKRTKSHLKVSALNTQQCQQLLSAEWSCADVRAWD